MKFITAFLRGDWLNARRVRMATLVLMLAQVAGLIVVILGTHGLIVPVDKPTTTDFVSFYAAGKMVLGGTPALAYDRAAHFAMEQAVTQAGIGYQFFFYPPVYLLLCALLAMLPYLVSFVLFEAVTLGFFLWVLRRLIGQYRGWWVAALAFPPVYWAMGLGQNSFLTAGLLGWGMLLLPRRRFLAGLVLGALCYKPHFGLLLPLALLLGRHWRAIAGAAVSVLSLTGLTALLFGARTWHAYLLAMQSSRDIYESGRIDFIGMATPFAGALQIGLSPVAAHVVQIAAILFTSVLVGWVWAGGGRARGRLDARPDVCLDVRAAALAAGTLLAVHLALIYDVVLVLLAIAFLLRAGAVTGFRAGEKTVYAAVYLLLLLVTKWLALRGAQPPPPLPLVPLASAAILALCVRRAMWERAGRRRADADSGLAGATGTTL